MIDLKNAKFLRIRCTKNHELAEYIKQFFIEDETTIETYETTKCDIIFTNFRIIIVNMQGVNERIKSFAAIPYSKIQAFSLETVGTNEKCAQLSIGVSSEGEIKFEFSTSGNIIDVCKYISKYSI